MCCARLTVAVTNVCQYYGDIDRGDRGLCVCPGNYGSLSVTTREREQREPLAGVTGSG